MGSSSSKTSIEELQEKILKEEKRIQEDYMADNSEYQSILDACLEKYGKNDRYDEVSAKVLKAYASNLKADAKNKSDACEVISNYHAHRIAILYVAKIIKTGVELYITNEDDKTMFINDTKKIINTIGKNRLKYVSIDDLVKQKENIEYLFTLLIGQCRNNQKCSTDLKNKYVQYENKFRLYNGRKLETVGEKRKYGDYNVNYLIDY